ncbi:MAG: hypothetical protein J6K88_04255 [Oscillospiraceae bacterium]|nr:hypothetical protein [Oscillospiraceae bacterium]
MKDKTKAILKTIGLILIVCLLGTILVVNIIITTKNKPSTSGSESTSSEEGETVYKLSEYNGKLAVFLLGDSEPVKVYDLFLSSLPTKDADMLKDGILVYNKSDLQQLIEDYTS